MPGVPGIAEAFHARFTDHVYPPHAHDTWTLMVVDDGVIRYDLHRHEHGAPTGTVLLLPPHIAHTGRAATARGFRKRVLYLDPTSSTPPWPAGSSTSRRCSTTCCIAGSTSCTAAWTSPAGHSRPRAGWP